MLAGEQGSQFPTVASQQVQQVLVFQLLAAVDGHLQRRQAFGVAGQDSLGTGRQQLADDLSSDWEGSV